MRSGIWKQSHGGARMSPRYGLIPLLLCSWALGQAQTRPAPLALSEDDPALVPILVWQLERGDTAAAEQLLKANLARIKDRLETVVREIDQEFDIIGRFGAVSIRFGPGYDELEKKNRRYEKLFTLYRRLGGDENLSKRFEARKLRVEGAHYTNQGENVCGEQMDWDGAQKLYLLALERLEAAFALAKEVNDIRLMASTKNNIGSTLIRLGRSPEALQAYQEGLRYAEQAPGDMYTGLVNLNLGNTYVWLGQPDESLQHSQPALTIFKKIGRGTWEANALMVIGNAYLRQQKFANAWETLQLALAVAQQNGEYRVYGRSLLNLGMAGLRLRKSEATTFLEKALQWYKDDTEVYPAIEREVVLQDGLRLLSQVAEQAGNTEMAQKYMRELAEALGPDPERYAALRQSPCFEIYQARPMPQATASR